MFDVYRIGNGSGVYDMYRSGVCGGSGTIVIVMCMCDCDVYGLHRIGNDEDLRDV